LQLEEENIDSHQELMVFPEFIESVARLGVLKYFNTADADSDEETLIESMKKALDRISSDD